MSHQVARMTSIRHNASCEEKRHPLVDQRCSPGAVGLFGHQIYRLPLQHHQAFVVLFCNLIYLVYPRDTQTCRTRHGRLRRNVKSSDNKALGHLLDLPPVWTLAGLLMTIKKGDRPMEMASSFMVLGVRYTKVHNTEVKRSVRSIRTSVLPLPDMRPRQLGRQGNVPTSDSNVQHEHRPSRGFLPALSLDCGRTP